MYIWNAMYTLIAYDKRYFLKPANVMLQMYKSLIHLQHLKAKKKDKNM